MLKSAFPKFFLTKYQKLFEPFAEYHETSKASPAANLFRYYRKLQSNQCLNPRKERQDDDIKIVYHLRSSTPVKVRFRNSFSVFVPFLSSFASILFYGVVEYGTKTFL